MNKPNKLIQLNVNPNATPEEKKQSLETILSKIQKILLIVLPLAGIVSLLFILLGNSFVYTDLLGEKISCGFSSKEIDSLSAKYVKLLGPYLALAALSYTPSIIAFILEAVGLLVILKFASNKYARIALLIATAVSALVSVLLFLSCFGTYISISTTKYYQPELGPTLISFVVLFLNIAAAMCSIVFTSTQKQLESL